MAKNPRLIDLSGKHFGSWRVLYQTGNTPRGAALWRCICECGTERDVISADLRNGKSLGCGCAGRKRIGDLHRSHGATRTRLHRIWKGMRARCRNPRKPGFRDYGGRGISICPEWNDFQIFRDWALNTGYRDDLSIERLDVNGNYEPTNCVWADAQAQSKNRRFVAKAPSGRLWWHIAHDNGITAAAYRTRLCAGWSYHEAATWPMNKKRRDGNLSRAVFLTVAGEKLPMAHAAKKIGYSASAIPQRAKRRGISLQEALDELAGQAR